MDKTDCNVLAFRNRERPESIFVIGAVVYKPDALQTECDGFLREFFSTPIPAPGASVFSLQCNERARLLLVVKEHLRPFFNTHVQRDLSDRTLSICGGGNMKSRNFYDIFSVSLFECIPPAGIDESMARGLRNCLKNINRSLLIDFGNALRTDARTSDFHSRTDCWKVSWRTIVWPKRHPQKEALYIIFEAFIDHYVVPFWSAVRRECDV